MRCQELKTKLDQKETLQLIDVREPSEWQFARIDGALHIPLHTIPARYPELKADIPIVVYCHHGGRSASAVAFLRQQGFTNIHNLEGGIDAWSVEVDPGKPRY